MDSDDEGYYNETPANDEGKNRKKKRKKRKLSDVEHPKDINNELLPAMPEKGRSPGSSRKKLVPTKGLNSGTPLKDSEKNDGRMILTKMSNEDFEELLHRIDLQCPVNDTQRSVKRENEIKWEEVAFSTYGPTECKLAWSILKTQARTYRNLHEVVDEMIIKVKTDYNAFMKKAIECSPSFPKVPYEIGGFQYFCMQLWNEHKEKQRKKNAKIGSFLVFQQKCYLDWQKVPEERKEHCNGKAKEISTAYKAQVKEYCAQFPEFFPKESNKEVKEKKPPKPRGPRKRKSKEQFKDAPSLPSTPLQEFVHSKLNRLDPPPNPDDISDLKGHYVEKWKKLSDSKRAKYIQKSLKKADHSISELKEYKERNPTYSLPEGTISRLISREEYNVWAAANGQPPIPAVASFDVFFNELSNSEDAGSAEDKKELRLQAENKWKEMDWYQKKMYMMKFKMQQLEFRKDWTSYYNGLPAILKDHAMKVLPNKYKKVLEDEVGKPPLIFGDEATVPVDFGDLEDNTNQDEINNGEYEDPPLKSEEHASQSDETTQDEGVEKQSPRKRKKKRRTR